MRNHSITLSQLTTSYTADTHPSGFPLVSRVLPLLMLKGRSSITYHPNSAIVTFILPSFSIKFLFTCSVSLNDQTPISSVFVTLFFFVVVYGGGEGWGLR